MPSRRRVLEFAATGTALAAGCLTTSDDAPTTSDAAPTTSDAATPTGSERDSPDGPERGDAEAVSVDRTVVDESYEYVESNETVRYPAVNSGGTVVEYGYEPFEEWAYVEGASTAARRVGSLLADRLPSTDGLPVGMGQRDESTEIRVAVSLRTHLDRDGDVISEPAVSLPEVVAETPQSITATLHFAGRTETNTYPVYVREAILRNQ
jgi:hypothetical protein